jgi:hypothetical protein
MRLLTTTLTFTRHRFKMSRNCCVASVRMYLFGDSMPPYDLDKFYSLDGSSTKYLERNYESKKQHPTRQL